MPLQFALVSETNLVSQRDLYFVARLAEIGARHTAEDFQREPPAVDVFEDRRKLPVNPNLVPVIFVEKSTDPGVLARHSWDPIRRGPAARVFCSGAPDLLVGVDNILGRTSHEISEAMIDPKVNLWLPWPGRTGVDVALEVADMVQSVYRVDYKGTPGDVSNYVTMWWFDEVLLDSKEATAALLASGQYFDRNRELSRPGEIGPLGYAIARTRKGPGWDVWPEGPSGAFASWKPEASDSKAFPGGRTYRRGVQL